MIYNTKVPSVSNTSVHFLSLILKIFIFSVRNIIIYIFSPELLELLSCIYKWSGRKKKPIYHSQSITMFLDCRGKY